MSYAISFMERLLKAFLTGFALATGVHFLIFPLSSRKVVLKESAGYLMCLTGLLQAQTAYMQSLEVFRPASSEAQADAGASKHSTHTKKSAIARGPLHTPASAKVEGTLAKLMELHNKLQADMVPAKREFAVGKLESHDFTELWKLLRRIFIPVVGLSTAIGLIQRQAAEHHWDEAADTEEQRVVRSAQLDQLHQLMQRLHEPFARTSTEFAGAVQHVLLTLELIKRPKKKVDEETGSDSPPGSTGFARKYRERLMSSQKLDGATIESLESSFDQSDVLPGCDLGARDRHQRQLFFILHLRFLLHKSNAAMLDLVDWADKLKSEGRMHGSKLVFPGSKTLYKWMRAVFSNPNFAHGSDYIADEDSGNSTNFLGSEFAQRKDPEHLPPSTTRERLGEKLRLIPRFFRSDASAFGFRVVCATLTVAVIGYLHDSQSFFVQERVLWAEIMIAISLNRTAGQVSSYTSVSFPHNQDVRDADRHARASSTLSFGFWAL